MLVPEFWASEKDFISTMNRKTDPKAPRFKYNLTEHVPDIEHKKLRALLDECKLLMLEVMPEFHPHYRNLHVVYFPDGQVCCFFTHIYYLSTQRILDF